MAHLPIPRDDDASPEQKVLFKHTTKLLGRVANAIRVASHSPKIAQTVVGFIVPTLREEITNNLPVRTKVLVILKTSTLNACRYWTTHNTTLGRALDINEAEIESLKGDYMSSALFTDPEKSAMRWAEVLTLKQYHGAPGEKPQSADAMAALKEHYNEAQIVEISMVSGFFNFWNRFADGLQVDLEENPVMNLIQRSAHVSKDDYIAFMRDCWWNHEEPDKGA